MSASQREHGLRDTVGDFCQQQIGDRRVIIDVDVRHAQTRMLLWQHLRGARAERTRRIDDIAIVNAPRSSGDEQQRQRAHRLLTAQRVRQPHWPEERDHAGGVEVGGARRLRGPAVDDTRESTLVRAHLGGKLFEPLRV